MKKITALCLVLLLLCSGWQPSSSEEATAFDGLVQLAETSRKKTYVYNDYALGWNRYVLRNWIGEKGVKPPDMEEAYSQEIYQGLSSIKCDMDFTRSHWGGYIFNSGSLQAKSSEPMIATGDKFSGENLAGATKLEFFAKGKEGGEKVAFFCGGMGHDAFGESLPFADSSPQITTKTITLTTQWKPYSISLKEKDMSHISYGFAWIAYQEKNPNKEHITFYLDEIAYLFDAPQSYPLLLPSYAPYPTDTEEYIINTMGYINDNALALLAFLHLERPDLAIEIANGLVYASLHDRSFNDYRLRNAYMFGNIQSYPGWNSNLGDSYALIPGFYHHQTMKWHEDLYAVSSNLVTQAWAILALSHMAASFPKEKQYQVSAQHIADFALTYKDSIAPGFFSGWEGWEGAQSLNTYKETRENLMLYAAFSSLLTLENLSDEKKLLYTNALKSLEDFFLSQFDSTTGAFLSGEKQPSLEACYSLLDNGLAILLLPEKFSKEKQQALEYIEKNLSVEVKGLKGFCYCTLDKEGIFWQGSALMALVYQHLGEKEKADVLLHHLSLIQGEDGFVSIASKDYLATGRYSLHDNRPIYFFNRNHLGTTALVALAENALNPFSLFK